MSSSTSSSSSSAEKAELPKKSQSNFEGEGKESTKEKLNSSESKNKSNPSKNKEEKRRKEASRGKEGERQKETVRVETSGKEEKADVEVDEKSLVIITLEVFHPHATEDVVIIGDLSGGWETGKRLSKHETIPGLFTRSFRVPLGKTFHYRFFTGKTYFLHPFKPQVRLAKVGLVNFVRREYTPSYIFAEYSLPSHVLLQVCKGDLTDETTDAIVNAANAYLSHGSGLARNILDKGGEEIDVEGRKWLKGNELAPGGCAITPGGKLPCKYVLHAVGPRWGRNFWGQSLDKDAPLTLRNCVLAALKLIDEKKLGSVAVPSISSGIYGGEKDYCARVIVDAVLEYLAKNASATSLRLVRFVNIDAESTDKFLDELKWRYQQSYLPL